MKYYKLFGDHLWIETTQGIMALTDKQKRVRGFLAPIRNQILEQDIQSLIQAHRRLENDREETKES